MDNNTMGGAPAMDQLQPQPQPQPEVQPQMEAQYQFQPQPQPTPAPLQDDIIISNGPVKQGPWKILTIVFLLTTLAAGALAAVFFISNDNAQTELAKARGTASIVSQASRSAGNLSFDPENIVNTIEGATYNLDYNDMPFDFIRNVDFSDKNIKIAFFNEELPSAYRKDGVTTPEEIELKFDQPVVDIYASFNATNGYVAGFEEKLLFLLEDGTVQYLPLHDAFTSNDFSLKTYEELSGIVKFYHVWVGLAGGTGGIYTFAQASDGSIYNLYLLDHPEEDKAESTEAESTETETQETEQTEETEQNTEAE